MARAAIGGGKNLAASIMAGVAAGLALTLLLSVQADANVGSGLVLVNLITSLSLGFCYWAFLNLNITSLRIRILREMLERESQTITHEHLRGEYGEDEMLQRRLRRLVEAAQIRYKDGRYTVQSSALLVLAGLLRWLRKILSLPRPDA